MIKKLIKDFSEINPLWIVDLLSQKFTLNASDISNIEIINKFRTPTSKIARVEISYRNKNANLPASLFVKISKGKLKGELAKVGKKEVCFYKNIADKYDKNNILNCYFAEWDEDGELFNFVFEDLTNSHFNTQWPIPPNMKLCYQIMDVLAKIHSSFWAAPNLNDICHVVDKKSLEKKFKQFSEDRLDKFISHMGDRLSEKSKEIIQFCKDNYSVYINRTLGHKNLTLIHRDSHFWNILIPRSENGNIKIIDWQTYGIGLGARDLAYMIALHWYPNRRKEHEHKLLHSYHQSLLKNGIQNYSFDNFLADYKLSILDVLFIPIRQWSNKVDAMIWWSHLERGLNAFDDLHCRQLFAK
jgi:thiamine kinase-like enzyme